MNTRRLAWNGVALDVPHNWEIARYEDRKNGSRRLEIEDEYSVRLVVDWIRTDRPRGRVARFTRETLRLNEDFAAHAQRTRTLAGLPSEWKAVHYEFREVIPTRRTDRGLSVVPHSQTVAMLVPPPGQTLVCLTFNFLPGDSESPEDLVRCVTASFTVHGNDPIPWQAFDIAFELPAAFLLEGLSFDIGAKYLVYRWKRRRFHLWILSCADTFLEPDTRSAEWIVGFLNAQRRIPGLIFLPTGTEAIGWRRRWSSRICHRDELSRWCFRYRVGYRIDTEKNQLWIAVLNYRHDEDLRQLAVLPGLGRLSFPGRPSHAP